MGDTNNAGSPSKTQTPQKAEPKTYIEGTPEYTEHIANIKAAWGRDWKAKEDQVSSLTSERDSLKTQLDKVTTEITSTKDSIAELNQQIDTLAKDDPDKKGLIQLRNDYTKKLTELKAKDAEYQAKETSLSEREKKAQKFERDQLIFEIADGFTDASGNEVVPDALMKAADKFKVSDREGLIALAEEKGWKAKAAQKEPEDLPGKPDSGANRGGADSLDGLSAKERMLERDRRIRQGKK